MLNLFIIDKKTNNVNREYKLNIFYRSKHIYLRRHRINV